MIERLEKRLEEISPEDLQAIMPCWYFEAVDMVEAEPELYTNTPAKVALNAFFDNLQDSPKVEAVDLMAAVLLNSLEVFDALELAGLRFCTFCRSIHSEDTRDHEQTCQGVLA